MVICNESSVELPERFMDPGAILDLCEWEIAGELNCDTNVEFPVFVKKGEDKFLYCGIYKFGEWDVVPVKTWEKLSDAVKKYWCRHVITSTAGVSMLNEQGLKPPGAARKFLPKEIEGFFLEDLDREEKGGLRLSRTEICPIRSEANVYKTLCKTHEKKTHPQPPNTTTPSAGASSRNQKRPSTAGGSGSKSGKRIRLEKEPADKDTIEFPFERMSPRRTRTSDVNYNLVTMSKKDLAESGLVSDSSEDDEDVVQKFVTRRKALTAGRASMDADDGESSEEE